MEQLVSYDLREGIIQGYVASTDLEVLREIEINFQEFVDRNKTENYSLEVTGIPIMFKRLDDSIIRSQIYSLIIAILLVVALISFLQRSIIKGLLAIIPVVATLILLFGTMGNTSIPLDIATVLTGSVTIGIGIDYAIHFISYFGNAYQTSHNIRESIEKSIHGSGRAILINMLSVTIGFAVLLLSNLVPLQRFGFLIAVTMIVSGMAALTLLPVALLMTGEKLGNIFKLRSKPTSKE
jgi:predicted RND superfamily exporter protein